jgi:hypothetical protein
MDKQEGRDELYPLSDSVVRALIAVAEYPEDPFRLGCLMLLADLRTNYFCFCHELTQ